MAILLARISKSLFFLIHPNLYRTPLDVVENYENFMQEYNSIVQTLRGQQTMIIVQAVQQALVLKLFFGFIEVFP